MKKMSLSLLTLFFVSICTFAEPIHLIPQPVSVTEKPGRFTIDAGVRLRVEDPSLQPAAAWFSTQMGIAVGKGKREIILSLPRDKNILGKEGYSMSITPSAIHITANEPAGAFYGLQTLLQLLPVDTKADGKWVPCAGITDYPRFPYRGMHLDVSRHFFPVSFIKKFIDLLALYRFNTFHWHLVDGAGWRLQIKKYPLLTDVAAWRTQADLMQ